MLTVYEAPNNITPLGKSLAEHTLWPTIPFGVNCLARRLLPSCVHHAVQFMDGKCVHIAFTPFIDPRHIAEIQLCVHCGASRILFDPDLIK